MSRPPLEVADIVRCAGQSFLEHSRRWMNWQHQKVLLAITRCWPSRAAAPRRWVDIVIAALAADVPLPSLTTRVAIGIVQDAKAARVCAGSRRANESFCLPTMCMPSLPCRENWLP